MVELLFELFSEEIPARMQEDAQHQLQQKLEALLKEQGIGYQSVRTYSTPRRLTAVVEGLPLEQPDKTVEKRGPRVDGPEAALEGFIRSTGLAKEQLEIRSTPKGDFYFAQTIERGSRVADVLKVQLEQLILGFYWPKSMQWGDHKFRWVRPIRNILCIFDGKVVPVTIEHLVANNRVDGHRFLGNKGHAVSNFQDYNVFLKQNSVVLDRQERKAQIQKQISELAANHGYQVREDEGLIDEITGLVEFPSAAMGVIDTIFMELPSEVLVSTMRNHQRYIALEDKAGRLAARFITVCNIPANEAIIAGNERVLRARLSDAQFYWEQDQRVSLDEWAKKLDNVVFHARIGMIADKITHITSLAKYLAVWIPHANLVQVERAAQLCKADLPTGVVGEFPELQGIIGAYYAAGGGEEEPVVMAIQEHYRPVGRSDQVPTHPVSIAVALADKLDTLVGLFAIDEKPTGSKDPFALRRAALGIIRIIIDNQLRIPLKLAIDHAISSYQKRNLAHKKSEIESDVLCFIIERLKVYLRDGGIRHDYIQAVFGKGNEDDIFRMAKRAEAMNDFIRSSDGTNLVAAFKRAANILRIEEQKSGHIIEGNPHKSTLSEDAEINLFTQLSDLEPAVVEAIKEDQFVEAMTLLSRLRQPVDCFFDQVRVNSENQSVRLNRLKLLSQFRRMLMHIGDFSLIESATETVVQTVEE